jgi:gliding motility-associated-like protein
MHKSLLLLWALCMSFFSLMAQHTTHPLVENRGQWPAHVSAAADVEGGKVFLEENAITYHLFDLAGLNGSHAIDSAHTRIRGHVYKVNFVGSGSEKSEALFEGKQQPYSNYFLGNDPEHWAGHCSHFTHLTHKNLYPGIDWVTHGDGSFLKYDFIVHAGADADLIRMRYQGQEKLAIENDRLVVYTHVGDVTEQKPIAWQIIRGEKHPVACEYRLKGNEVTFKLGNTYDPTFDLTIDPELVFSTFSGSTSDNFGYTATFDKYGSLYSGSSAFGQGYPSTTGAYDTTHNGGDSGIGQGIDIALTRYSINGTFMVWSTFLGGSGDELPHSIIVNDQEELIVYGSTGSADYPITAGAIDNTFGGGPAMNLSGTGALFPSGADIIVSRLGSFGESLLASTYIGGSANDGICDAAALKYNYADEFRGEVELDDDGNILIVSSTRSADIATSNAIQAFPGGGLDALVGKLNVEMTQAIWLTYFGQTGDDSGFSIANNAAGEHIFCGGTTSPTLNLGPASAQQVYGGGTADAYIVRLAANGNQLLGGTYWGGTAYDQAYFIEVDNNDFVYIYGQTAAGNNLIQNAAYSNANSGNLIAKFDANLHNAIWSTVIGTGDGKPNLSPAAFLVDQCNRVYISGWGINLGSNLALNPGSHLAYMASMPVTADAFDGLSTSGDFYMAVFDNSMTQLEYATFIGGDQSDEHVDGGTSRFDKKGVIYQSVCAGCGSHSDFPTYPSNAWSTTNNAPSGGCNNAVYKFDFQLPISVADFNNDPTDCIGNLSNFISNSIGAETYLWDFGDGTTSSEENPSHLYAQAGTYTITLTVSSANTCNGTDSAEGTITITDPQEVNLQDVVVCASPNNVLSVPTTEGIFSWSPSSNLSDPTGYSTFYYGTESQDFTITQINSGCITHFTLHADVLKFEILTTDTVLCEPDEITLSAQYSPSDASIIWSDTNNWGFNTQLNDDSTDVDITVQATHSAVYYVQIVSGACAIEQSVYVQLADDQTSLQGDFTICSDEPVMLSVENPAPQFSYSWTPAALIVAGQNTSTIMANISEATLFTVTSVSDDGCIASDSVLVSISTLNPQNVVASATPSTIAPGENALLNASPGGYTYSWTPASSLNNAAIANPLAAPQQTTIYTVTISDSQCTASDTAEVRVITVVCGPPSIFIPNTFTPNADGKNEKLYVRGINLSKVHLAIYNRWGQLVFETYAQNEGWDGTFKEMKVDPDVFVYYLEATCDGGEEYFEKGNITLIR